MNSVFYPIDEFRMSTEPRESKEMMNHGRLARLVSVMFLAGTFAGVVDAAQPNSGKTKLISGGGEAEVSSLMGPAIVM